MEHARGGPWFKQLSSCGPAWAALGSVSWPSTRATLTDMSTMQQQQQQQQQPSRKLQGQVSADRLLPGPVWLCTWTGLLKAELVMRCVPVSWERAVGQAGQTPATWRAAHKAAAARVEGGRAASSACIRQSGNRLRASCAASWGMSCMPGP